MKNGLRWLNSSTQKRNQLHKVSGRRVGFLTDQISNEVDCKIHTSVAVLHYNYQYVCDFSQHQRERINIMKLYITVLLLLLGLGAQPAVAGVSFTSCENIVAADLAATPEPEEEEEEPDCE